MNPEDTDKFKSYEDVMERLASAPKKQTGDLEKSQAAKPNVSDNTAEEVPEDPNA